MNDEIIMRTPAGRWRQAEELAGTAVFLASKASDFYFIGWCRHQPKPNKPKG